MHTRNIYCILKPEKKWFKKTKHKKRYKKMQQLGAKTMD